MAQLGMKASRWCCDDDYGMAMTMTLLGIKASRWCCDYDYGMAMTMTLLGIKASRWCCDDDYGMAMTMTLLGIKASRWCCDDDYGMAMTMTLLGIKASRWGICCLGNFTVIAALSPEWICHNFEGKTLWAATLLGVGQPYNLQPFSSLSLTFL